MAAGSVARRDCASGGEDFAVDRERAFDDGGQRELAGDDGAGINTEFIAQRRRFDQS